MWKKFWPADAPTVRVFWWDRESWSGKWGLFKEQRVRDTIKLWMDDNDLSLSLGYNIIHGIPNSENFAFMKKCNVIFVAGAKMIPPDSMSDLDRKGATVVLLRLGGEFELNKKLPGKDGYCYTEITCRNKADVAKAIQVGMDAWFSSPASRSIKESALNLKKAKSGEETRFLTQLRVELEGKVKNLEKNVQELQVSNRAEKENNERQKKQIVQLQSSLKDMDIIIQQLTEEKAGLDQKVYVSEIRNRGLEAALKDKDYKITQLKTALENKKSEEEMQIVLAKNEVLKNLLEEKTEAEDEILGLRIDKERLAAVIVEKDIIIKQQAEMQAKMAEERQLLKTRYEVVLIEKAEAEDEKQELQRDKERMASQLSLAKESEQKYKEMKENYLASLRALTEWSQQWQNTEEQRKKENKEFLHALGSVQPYIDQSLQNSAVQIIATVEQTGDYVVSQLQMLSAPSSGGTSEVSSAETA